MTAYQRIADSLRQRLLEGCWQPGERLPTERELCRQFAASQITVRRAMQILEQEHLIERRQGSGSFATTTAMRKIPILNTDFFGSVRRHAPPLKRRLENWRWDKMDTALAETFRACPGDPILRAMRIDLLNETPVAVDEAVIPKRYAERLNKDDLGQLDFLRYWQQVQKIRLSHCDQVIEAVKAADSPMGKLLAIGTGEPVLKETTLLYIDGSQPAGLFVTYYRHDSFRFEVTFDLDRPKPRKAKHG